MLKIGDHVKWKFRYGETYGIITKIHTSDFASCKNKGVHQNKDRNMR